VSNTITVHHNNAIEPLDDERQGLLRRTLVPKDITNDEFALFVDVCNRRQLDPFARQIYAVKRSGKLVIQTGIDGFRLIAQRTGQYLGQDGPYWCGDDGQWRDTWFAKTPPRAAKVGVLRRGTDKYTYAVAHWDEYADPNNSMWQRMPRNQLAKCAESLALRKAFPEELSGLYTTEEMQQADVPLTQLITYDDNTAFVDTDGVIHDAPVARYNGAGHPEAPHTADNTYMATAKQIAKITVEAKNAGWHVDEWEQLRQHLFDTYNVNSRKDLTVAQASELIDYLISQQPQAQESLL
jgi:phage recombination protein Bet